MLSKSLSNGSLKGITIIGTAARVPSQERQGVLAQPNSRNRIAIYLSDEDLIESGVSVGCIRNDSNFTKVDGDLS
jgi:hypothetical protein